MKRPATAALGLLLACGTAAAADKTGELRAFDASYAAVFRGIDAGISQLKLEKLPDNRWSYTSRSQAQGVFRLALTGPTVQRSLFVLHEGQVKPLEFTSEIGIRTGDRNQTMHFDWDAGRVTGTAEGKPVNLPLEPGVLDALSVQIAMMLKLINGQVPDHFRMIDKTKIKDYLYTHEGEETVTTALGPQHTVIFRSARAGSTHGTFFWCAPSLGYVPVKVERRDGTNVEWSMTLKTLAFGAAR
ncbi:MAG: hypothetical protein RL030_1545 [Pseudomonadota bacterium]